MPSGLILLGDRWVTGLGVVGCGAGQVGCRPTVEGLKGGWPVGFYGTGLYATHGTLLSFQRLVHPFEIPELFSLPMDQGDVRYLKWLEEGMEEE